MRPLPRVLPALLLLSAPLSGCQALFDLLDLGGREAPICVEGNHMDGAARYAACMPPNWNGKLIVWAHGYQSTWDEPIPQLHDDVIAPGFRISDLSLGLNYGWATTSYSAAGLVVQEAMDDLEDLVDVFQDRFEVEVDRSYLLGGSEGGFVTARSLERPDTPFDGGLMACAPTGDLMAQVHYLGDVRVLFDYFFPGVLPGDAVSVPQELPVLWDEVYRHQVLAALDREPHVARQLMAVAGVPRHVTSRRANHQALVDLLWYNVFGTHDLLDRLGGNPYGNLQRVYTGSSNDAHLNEHVQRFAPDPEARQELRSMEATGRLQRQAVQLHSVYDPIVPYWHSTLYRDRVRAEDRANLYIRQTGLLWGHCNFSLPEVLLGFERLVIEVEGLSLFVPDWMKAEADAQAVELKEPPVLLPDEEALSALPESD